jgi:molecular chaperone DnaK
LVTVNVLQGEAQLASGNKSLGRFNLENIPPAPRGVPQIEVSFEIDQNGIVKATARDLGTGRVQEITITGSTKLSEEELSNAAKSVQAFEAA